MIPLITGQAVAFWIFAVLAVAGALGMITCRKPVHSALCLAGMMVSLACIYAALDAPFLFVSQIIVYTGAVMMLFLFTMMIVGVDTTDSMIETIKGHRVASFLIAAGFGVMLVIGVVQGAVGGAAAGLEQANGAGNVQGIARIVFGPFLYPFLATSALIMIATMAAIVLSHGERLTPKQGQIERARARNEAFMATGADPGPMPAPGTYARKNSIDQPALLPDGSVAASSISPTLNVRGVAVVSNDGLRSAHRAAITRFVEDRDAIIGTNTAQAVAEELDDLAQVADDQLTTTGEGEQ